VVGPLRNTLFLANNLRGIRAREKAAVLCLDFPFGTDLVPKVSTSQLLPHLPDGSIERPKSGKQITLF
jgi:hypothetical protein